MKHINHNCHVYPTKQNIYLKRYRKAFFFKVSNKLFCYQSPRIFLACSPIFETIQFEDIYLNSIIFKFVIRTTATRKVKIVLPHIFNTAIFRCIKIPNHMFHFENLVWGFTLPLKVTSV